MCEVLEKNINRIEDAKAKKRAIVIFNLWLSPASPVNLRVDELTTAHIRLFIDERIAKVKPSSVNREIDLYRVGSAFGLYRFSRTRILELSADSAPESRKIAPRKIDQLGRNYQIIKLSVIAETPDEKQIEYEKRHIVGQAFQMCLLTGSRIGEITALRWSQIDFDQNILQIVGRKNRYKSAKNVRYLELNPTIEKILRQRKQADLFGEFVFCRTGNSITDYYEIMRKAAKAAKFPTAETQTAALSPTTRDTRQLQECFKPELTSQQSAQSPDIPTVN